MADAASDLAPYVTAENTFKSRPITGVTREAVWKESMSKVHRPDLFLPVTDVSTKQNDDGSVFRSMKFSGEKIDEIITWDEPAGVIKFHVLDKDGKPTNEVHYNVIREEEGGITLEYYNLDLVTQAKTPLKGVSAFVKIAENARAACKAKK